MTDWLWLMKSDKLVNCCSLPTISCWLSKENLVIKSIFFSVSPLCRPEHLDLTRRVATMGSRARPAAKIIKINHITKATARKEKMCETLHKRIFADRAGLARPHHPTSTPPLLTVWSHFYFQISAKSLSSFWGRGAEKRKGRKKIATRFNVLDSNCNHSG